jgi:hypothetical protein
MASKWSLSSNTNMIMNMLILPIKNWLLNIDIRLLVRG